VNHGIGRRGTAAQTLPVFELAAMYLGAAGRKGLGARIGTGKPQHLMARLDELGNEGGANKPGGTGDKNTHEISPLDG
jgi:hypothetical protein